jgi:ABC-type multidrug transport system fused ATPase/permease subunit
MRKVLCTTIYDKIGRLSLKSLNNMDSSRLINLVSSDLFMIERPIVNAYYIVVAPFINIVAYLFIGFSVGWWYSLITFGFWVVTFVGQHFVSKTARGFKH